MKHYIDVDGTIADGSRRSHHLGNVNRDAGYFHFFNEVTGDKLVTGAAILDTVLKNGTDVAFLTGRPERTRGATTAWLSRHFPHFDPSQHAVLMRPDSLLTPNHLWKVQELALRHTPQDRFVFVDDDKMNRLAVQRSFENAMVMAPLDAWDFLKTMTPEVVHLTVDADDKENEVYDDSVM